MLHYNRNKVKLSMCRLFLVVVLVVSTCVCQRNIQRQLDNLESRYDNDYLYLKENLRDLWTAFDTLETVHQTAVPQTTVTSLPNTKSAKSLQLELSPFLRGLIEEKKFVRGSLAKLSNDVANLEQTFVETDKTKGNRLDEMEKTCSTMMNDLKLLKNEQSRLVNRIQELDGRIGAEVAGLEMQMNQAFDKLVLDNLLNRPSSCADLLKHGVTASGVYTLYNKMQPFLVYCLMKTGGGYTFISPETYIEVNIADISIKNPNHVIIRHRRTNGLQYESRIEQISRYNSRALSVQYNAHAGYKGIVNNQMTPYVYIGLTPKDLGSGRSHKGDRQGYKSNGKEFFFINCDGNPNGYFAFLFNQNNVGISSSVESSAISRRWIDSSVRVTVNLVPDKFMSFFEMHFGGCGAYVGANHIGEVSGATVGIPFTLK